MFRCFTIIPAILFFSLSCNPSQPANLDCVFTNLGSNFTEQSLKGINDFPKIHINLKQKPNPADPVLFQHFFTDKLSQKQTEIYVVTSGDIQSDKIQNFNVSPTKYPGIILLHVSKNSAGNTISINSSYTSPSTPTPYSSTLELPNQPNEFSLKLTNPLNTKNEKMFLLPPLSLHCKMD